MNKAERLKQANELVTLFMSLFKERFHKTPVLNRYKQRFALSDILEDMSFDDLKMLLKYYVKVDAEPSLTSFCYEYDELYVKMQRDAKDEAERHQIRKETEQRVREFRERYGKNAQ